MFKYEESISFEEWLATRYLPYLGREGEDDDTEDETEDDDIVIEDEGDDDTEDEDDTSDDDDDNTSDDVLQQLAAARAELQSARAALRKEKAEARKARQKVASETGNWEAVAREHEATIADLQEQLSETASGKDTSEYELDQFKREVRVTRLASRLGYRDPADAIALLKDDVTGDDKTAERALRQLVEDKPYLRDPRKASGIPGNGSGGGRGGLTSEDLKNMTPDQINAAWEKGMVQSALTRGG